jgi:5'-deoxynucleotidase YfbR-like HD superfamily hydrolase
MHDAAEAFIGDITRPLKQLLPDYKRIEAIVEHAIFTRFDVPIPMPKEVKLADLKVLAAEQAQIMPPETWQWARTEGIAPAMVHVRNLPPEAACEAFLARFHDLNAQARKRGRVRFA